MGERTYNQVRFGDGGSVWAGSGNVNSYGIDGSWLMQGSGYVPVNAIATLGEGRPYRGFSSMHVGGAHFLMTDGSVHFISDTIEWANGGDPSRWWQIGPPQNRGVYQNLSTRNDGQVIGEF